MNIHEVKRVAVVGLGTMGHGIAQTFAVAGFEVGCFDECEPVRATLVSRVEANLCQLAGAGVVARDAVQAALQRIVTCDNLADAVADTQFVTEAVREELSVKQALFAELESLAGSQTILASNSSSYPISQTAADMQTPERAIVTHWFNPPHIVPVVEVVPGERTSEETAHATYQLLERIGKTPVRLNQEIPGFLVNRVQIAMFREIWSLLERGVASAEEIDKAICGSMGFRLAAIGPLAVNDFAGLDVTGRVYENLVTDLRSDEKLPRVVEDLVKEGHFGVKTGKGFYDYTPESVESKRKQRDERYLKLVKLLGEKPAADT